MRTLLFDPAAFEDLAWWVQYDRKKAVRIIRLIQETQADPFGGIGKPEPLKHALTGCWSKRIDHEHRLVYQVLDETIRILACRYHYE
ncbi:MAG TPA: Txe/YoeB family addiction module toxin [Roseiflexaceae bacterium]|nr:Txe/YoeB family addiction module toxin [Roseiflexaceae bacterium]